MDMHGVTEGKRHCPVGQKQKTYQSRVCSKAAPLPSTEAGLWSRLLNARGSVLGVCRLTRAQAAIWRCTEASLSLILILAQPGPAGPLLQPHKEDFLLGMCLGERRADKDGEKLWPHSEAL